MQKKTRLIIGWVLTGLISLALVMSAFIKISQGETGAEQAEMLGLTPAILQIIGAIELVSLVLFIIPRTGVVGTLLLIAYFGGAIVVHLVHGQPLAVAVIIEILIWITAAIRFPELPERLFKGRVSVVN